MGLFDFFLSDEAKIKKHHRRLTNRDAQVEDREMSAHWLLEHAGAQGILALLSRFDMTLEHQLKDKTEKDLVYELVATKGEAAREPLEAWLRQCKLLGNPLRLHQELFGRDATTEVVYGLLEREKERQDFQADRKRRLLIWLAEARHPGAIEVVEPFLEDFDEGVRYAASEVIIAQESEEGRLPLAGVLVNPEEDSNRLKVRICEVFATRRWRIDDVEGVAERLPEGYRVENGRVVSA